MAIAVSVPLSASDDTGEDFADAHPFTQDGVSSPPATNNPVTIARPVGTIRLAEVGEELGERRFEARTTRSAASIVIFSKQPRRSSARLIGGASIPSGMPLTSLRLTSQFGYRINPVSGRYQPHAGIDLAAPWGSPVLATADGTVDIAGWAGGYGLLIQVDHGDAIATRYAHLSRLAVTSGQFVKRGQIIGYVGSTGRSTGPHLHYEVREANVALDPLKWEVLP